MVSVSEILVSEILVSEILVSEISVSEIFTCSSVRQDLMFRCSYTRCSGVHWNQRRLLQSLQSGRQAHRRHSGDSGDAVRQQSDGVPAEDGRHV